jgi:outer membrane lipoprotein-sorting protein
LDEEAGMKTKSIDREGCERYKLRGAGMSLPESLWPNGAALSRKGVTMQAVARAALAAFFILAVTPPAAFPDADGEALLKRVADKYGGAATLTARFRQEVPLRNIGIVRKASGRVSFRRPLKMRWDYDDTGGQIFLADGEHFYFRPEGSPQVFRRRIDEASLGGKIPLLLLFGEGDITEMFRVEETIRRKDGEESALRLVPREDGAPDVRWIDMVVGTRDLLIREVHLYDRVGGANILYLEGTAFDVPLPGDHFRFRRPSGVEVVDG